MTKSSKACRQAFVDRCSETLRTSGARVTKTRLAVVRAMSEAKKPLSATKLYEVFSENKSLGKIDQVTIYRVLETLKELGLVHQVFPSGGYLPCFHQHCGDAMHVLVRCSSCEEVTELDVPQETLAPMFWYLNGEHGFSADEHLFQINGKCSSCSPK